MNKKKIAKAIAAALVLSGIVAVGWAGLQAAVLGRGTAGRVVQMRKDER